MNAAASETMRVYSADLADDLQSLSSNKHCG